MSLRARLVAVLVLVAAAVLVGGGVATSIVFSRAQLRQVDDNLDRVSGPIEALSVGGSPDALGQIERIAPGLLITRVAPDGRVTFAINGRGTGDGVVSVGAEKLWPARGVRHVTISGATVGDDDEGGGEQGRVRVRISELDDGGSLAIGESLHELDEARKSLVRIEAGVALAGLIFATVVGALLVTVGLRPLRRIERVALDIAAGGDLESEVPGIDESTEVGRLALALDVMLGRIREAFTTRDQTEADLRHSEEKMRRLVADASHELRTPLAAVSAYAELFDRGARDHPADLERAMQGISAETARMARLIEDLLLLARLDEARPVAAESIDLAPIIASAIEAASTVAPDWPITGELADTAPLTGDPSRLRQVIENLLANVRSHTPPGTQTLVSLRAEGGTWILSVSDNGPGMSEVDTEMAFERFHRADSSRVRTEAAPSGSGLGLSIVASLTKAHGGTASIEASQGHGVTVEIRLPADHTGDDS